MAKPTTLFVGLDSYREFDGIAQAAAASSNPRVFVGPVSTRQADIGKPVRRLHSKASHLAFACEAGPTGYGLHRHLAGKGEECRVVARSLIPERPGVKVRTNRRDAVDLTRFGNSRQFAAFVGLIPSEYSSGTTRRQGGITETGKPRARRALVEAAWAYRLKPKFAEQIQRLIEGLPKPIQAIGWKAALQLCARFRQLTSRGKHPNVAVTAIARELLAFMWAIAREVPLQD